MPYTDQFGRTWLGPFDFTLPGIQQHAPNESGVYMVLYGTPPVLQDAYIGIATRTNTIRNRLREHIQGGGNWGLGRIENPAQWHFGFFPCDETTAHEIETYVLNNHKPPLNVRVERTHMIPNITVH